MKVLVVLLSLLLVGCVDCDRPANKGYLRVNDPNNPHTLDVGVVVIDHCQYIVNAVHGGIVYTHKGNCGNPIHRRWPEATSSRRVSE